MIHADETGINTGGKRYWLHGAFNDLWTCYEPHEKRGTDAMSDMGILPAFKGILCHDHREPHYKYDCTHALCNAHHLRELTRAWEQDDQKWALQIKNLLEMINKEVTDAGGVLNTEKLQKYRQKYRELIKQAEIECPDPPRRRGKNGRVKKSKSRNLLECLRDYEDDTLRFMDVEIVPFTNNRGETISE
jgi:transposase